MEKRQPHRWVLLLGTIVVLSLYSRSVSAGFGDWFPLGPEGGDIYSVAWDPSSSNIAYSAGAGGVFKSVDGGWTWSRLTNVPPIFAYDVEIDSANPDSVYAATNQGAYKSTDAGDHWNLILSGDVTSIDVCPPCGSIWATTFGGGTYRSLDDGAHWSPQNNGLGSDLYTYTVRANPLNGKTYLGSFNGLYMWSGSAWLPSDQGIPQGAVGAIAFDPIDTSTLYAGTWNSGAFKSTNSGSNWISINTGLQASWVTGLTVDKNPPFTIYATTDDGFYRGATSPSASGGILWTRKDTGLDYKFSYDVKINYSFSDKLLLGSYGGGTSYSTNHGDDWTTSYSGISCQVTNAVAVDPLHPDTVYVANDGGLWKSINKGLGFNPINTGLNYLGAQAFAIDPQNTTTLYGGLNYVYRSADAGANWNLAGTGLSGDPLVNITVDPTASSTIYALTTKDLFKSIDSAQNWSRLTTGLTNAEYRGFAIDPTAHGTLYFTSDAGVGKSTDFGSTWKLMNNNISPPNVYAIAINPINSSNLLISSTTGVHKTTNGGLSWNFSNNGLGSNFTYSLQYDPTNPSKAYAGTTNGVAQTANGGDLWISVGYAFDKIAPASTPRQQLAAPSVAIAPYVFSLAVDPVSPSTIYAGTNAGAYSTTVSSASPCTAGPTTLCLRGGRFKVTVTWHDQHSPTLRTGVGMAVPDTDQTGRFWFFSSDAIELLVKIIDGRGINGSFWVFYGALSDVEYTITVIDTVDGKIKTYHNAPGNICGFADIHYTTTASSSTLEESSADLNPPVLEQKSTPASPAAREEIVPAAACAPTSTSLCLLSGRFKVSVSWIDQHTPGHSGDGTTIPSTDQTGYFWFFSADALELAVKIIDGRAVNGKFWVFYGALSDVEFTLTVTDTTNGAVETYHNAPFNICGNADIKAF